MPDGYICNLPYLQKSVCTLDEYGQRIIELTCSEEAKMLFLISKNLDIYNMN